ncbi:sodium-dependent bicarbonate transport family permease [Methyloradius palustris]|uniref:Sodium-dependent bicarbonate transport family permease n=1 Tax=Methyloradius palustris TaxID=2778876 RepID=A0A8D5FZD8_9PROT|nr:sodium-dependent bicarbonate transport family permease [Methyloradius palustris]BCM24530.1 sodium-dependent bicarbonate transport family permease [Methyloradius palustris]
MKTLLDPAILFFVFGLLAGLMKSNLEIPPQISRFLSLYLLMSLGLKGGFALAKSGVNGEVAITLACAVGLAISIPLLGYQILKRFVSGYDAAAIAATYGSVSAVTFITATQFLENAGIPFGGHMAAAMALMESPAIILAVLLANRTRHQLAPQSQSKAGVSLSKLLHESLTDGAQVLLIGALIIGLLTGEAGKAAMQPFSGDLFKGMLAFFLLDMGLLASRNISGLKGKSVWVFLYAIAAPLLHASIALGLAHWLHISAGNAVLLMVLAASASYIAVPAAIRFAIPEANPSLYVGMSLALTFPFNLIVGIPLYTWFVLHLL